MSSPIQPKLSIPTVLSTISKHFNPKMVALLNDEIEFRVAKVKGDFIWHSHKETDELFYILDAGPLLMKVRHKYGDESSEEAMVLNKGDMFVVPKGVQHCPSAENEVHVLMAERKGELNTGDVGVT